MQTNWRRLWVVIGTMAALLGPAAASERAARRGADDESFPLPKFLTEDERRLPLPTVVPGRAAPVGQIHCAAEYEPMAALLIAWEGFTDVLTPMVVDISNLDPAGKVYVVVDTQAEKNSATTSLTNAGADMSQVEFLIVSTNTVWIRDYGPRYIFVDGIRSIVDHTYNRPRPQDDAFNDFLAGEWSEPQYDIPLIHGGGNFHLFADGEAFMTRLILTENPGLTEQQVKTYYQQYQNLDVTLFDGFPTSFDSTQHIDMWMLAAADRVAIVGQYAQSTGTPYTITEGAVTTLQSRGYTVIRTPGWRTSAHYTYTNAVIFNNLVFMPVYNVANDTAATTAFQAAFPGKTIRPVNCNSIIGSAGAIHCIVMHVPANAPQDEPIVSLVQPNGGQTLAMGQPYDIKWVAVDNVAVTAIELRLSRDGGASYPETIASGLPNSGTYAWTPAAPPSAHARVKVIAYDGDGYSDADDSADDFTISPVGPTPVVNETLASNPEWGAQNQWQFGDPTGQGGTAHGNPDPQNGFTGDNVYGVNLAGDYALTVGGPWYLTAGPFDLSGVSQSKLSFRRWLNTDVQPYVTVSVQASNNGSSWTTVWSNAGAGEIAENAWSLQEYDISAVADDQAAVRVRWSYQVASSAWAYSGWNIDDLQIIGIPELVPGDLNCDGVVNFGDIDPFVIALAGETAYQAAHPDCQFYNADCDGSGSVNFGDIDAFVALLGG